MLFLGSGLLRHFDSNEWEIEVFFLRMLQKRFAARHFDTGEATRAKRSKKRKMVIFYFYQNLTTPQKYCHTMIPRFLSLTKCPFVRVTQTSVTPLYSDNMKG